MFPQSGCFWAKAYWLLCHSEVNSICRLDFSNSRNVFQTKPFFHGRNQSSTNKTIFPRTKTFFHERNHFSTNKTILPRTNTFHKQNHSSTDETIPRTKPFFNGRKEQTREKWWTYMLQKFASSPSRWSTFFIQNIENLNACAIISVLVASCLSQFRKAKIVDALKELKDTKQYSHKNM